MTLPPFSAEASLGRARGVYRTGRRGSAGTADSLSMQASIGRGLDALWPVFRCCRRPQGGGPFRCVEQRHRPWQHCTCYQGVFGPIILCRDIEISTADV